MTHRWREAESLLSSRDRGLQIEPDDPETDRGSLWLGKEIGRLRRVKFRGEARVGIIDQYGAMRSVPLPPLTMQAGRLGLSGPLLSSNLTDPAHAF